MNWFNYGVFVAYFVIDYVEGKVTVFTKEQVFVVYVDELRSSGNPLIMAIGYNGEVYVIDGDEWGGVVPLKR